jgi:hypothetical protein
MIKQLVLGVAIAASMMVVPTAPKAHAVAAAITYYPVYYNNTCYLAAWNWETNERTMIPTSGFSVQACYRLAAAANMPDPE